MLGDMSPEFQPRGTSSATNYWDRSRTRHPSVLRDRFRLPASQSACCTSAGRGKLRTLRHAATGNTVARCTCAAPQRAEFTPQPVSGGLENEIHFAIDAPHGPLDVTLALGLDPAVAGILGSLKMPGAP